MCQKGEENGHILPFQMLLLLLNYEIELRNFDDVELKLDCDKKTDVNEQLITDNSNLSARINELTAEKDRLSGTVGEQESVMLEFVEKIEKKEKELVAQLK